MAFGRKTLKAMGLTDEQVDTLIEMHGETVDGLKAEINKYKPDAEKLASVQKELDELKEKGDGGYKQKYEDEKKAHDQLKADIAAKGEREAKEKAYREVLKSAGIADKYADSVLGVAKLEELEFKDGKFTDEKLADTLKEKFPAFVENTSQKGADVKKPPASGGGSTMTYEQIRAIKDPAERRKAMAENPELFGLETKE